MWVVRADKSILEETLLHFLRSVHDRRPQVDKPLIPDDGMLHTLYAEPQPELLEAFQGCLDAFVVELSPEPAKWGKLQVSVSVLGLTFALYNSLSLALPQQTGDREKQLDLVEDFTSQLIAALPPARERDAALAYHAILYGLGLALPNLDDGCANLLHNLIELSPLTALWLLDMHTPAALNTLAAELLPGWQNVDQSQAKVWRKTEEWLDVVIKLLEDLRIARWLRHRWLAMPETRQACRNLGLLLEALRRRGEQREIILEFYEAYDYFCANTRLDEWGEQVRVWPVLKTIDKLLRVPGDSEAAIRINRRGNEYFLKFRPLVEIVNAEKGIPSKYRLLSREFVLTLRSLLDYITEGRGQHISFGELTFEEQRP